MLELNMQTYIILVIIAIILIALYMNWDKVKEYLPGKSEGLMGGGWAQAWPMAR